MENGDIDIRGILGVLRRQFRLIIITLVLVVATATAVAFTLRPIYTATSMVLVDSTQKNLLDATQQLFAPGADNARVESEVEIMRSSTILLSVIDQLKLISDPEFGVSLGLKDRLFSLLRLRNTEVPTGEAALQQSLGKLRSAVAISRRGATYLIALSVQSASPQRGAEIANAVAQTYVADQITSKINMVTSARDILQSQIHQSRNAIVQSETAFDNFMRDNIQRITEETGRSDLTNIQTQIQSLVTARQQTTALADTVQQQAAAGDWSSLVVTLQSDALAELQTQRDKLTTALASEQAGSPAEIDLRTELTNVEQSLRTQAQTEVETLRGQVGTSQQSEENLRQQLRQQVLSSDLSTGVLTDLYELQQNSEIARTQYQTLLTRVQDLDAQSNLQVADSRIVSPALPPQGPSFPNRMAIIGAAIILALVIGVLLAFLNENFIGGFSTEGQMSSVLKIRVATAIPKERDLSGGTRSLSDLIVTSPLSPFAESVRRVRAVVDHSTGVFSGNTTKGEGRVLMVTSTAPYEGKSTTALALARSYGGSGRNVLLIDCDLRKPSMQKHIGVEPVQGLRDFLATTDEAVSLEDFVIPDPLTSVTLVLATRNSAQPTDQLLASSKFAQLINAARRTFDVIILDTPPVGPVVDGLYIAPFADCIIFLTRWAVTAQTDVKNAVGSLAEAKQPQTEIIGVLSQQDAPRSAYMKKYGGYYQEAQS